MLISSTNSLRATIVFFRQNEHEFGLKPSTRICTGNIQKWRDVVTKRHKNTEEAEYRDLDTQTCRNTEIYKPRNIKI